MSVFKIWQFPFYLGVEAESSASRIQSKFYGGETRGWFSKLQSVGARFGSR